ncbi:preprotein translocase [Rhodococcus sp. IEGM 1401]|uniref:Preprotein translocase n=1 Tax=Rhodococcus cercidiphylli TaxID=489916 RepID=A0ABU4AVN2_9NOCA|nr:MULTISPECIES: preprotein translocase [Rhodococcus]MCZ4564210.1 preprotein translocase [Rhodococcus sp. IEGM 1401]MDI9924347.1 preprotein translocase [Rhodococcus sp. IEGM 1372]MDI9927274.1 preprotein translocase [Rhodococcus sp. IEGM 1341]MDV6230292.1 preprotein translocase [Rhodococcus cercidiphylli]MDV8036787.1 preprotein translocase [Rhodococcus sp. IEGM 1414]
MFGLTFEKLFLVAIIAGFVLGPQRLPGYAHQLTRAVRSVRHFVDTTRTAAEDEIGVPLRRSEWESMNLRQYDPRRIVSDALRDTNQLRDTESPSEQVLAEAARVRPGQKYLITGPSSHPRRILIDSLPQNDPRRIAAQLQPKAATSAMATEIGATHTALG